MIVFYIMICFLFSGIAMKLGLDDKVGKWFVQNMKGICPKCSSEDIMLYLVRLMLVCLQLKMSNNVTMECNYLNFFKKQHYIRKRTEQNKR